MSVLPSVSAIIATRGRASLRRSIEGVLDQVYDGPVTCIVVFDGTEPSAWPDLKVGNQRGLVALRNTRTSGLAGARNTGADAAEGELIAFCDDDDVWWPTKLRSQVDTLQRSDSTAVVTGVRIVAGGRKTDRIPPSTVTRDLLVRSRATEVHPSSVLVQRRAFLDRIGPIDEAIPGSYGEDYEWLLRAATDEPIAVVQAPLVTVHWGGSLFADRWQTIADAIGYITAKHPELLRDDANAARLFGRVAFAHAALRHRREAARWAWRGIRRRPIELRPYLALVVASGCVRPSTIQRRANRVGRGV
ncbi:MAG: glycosyltransferase family A protein [Actinomycetota bacterium]